MKFSQIFNEFSAVDMHQLSLCKKIIKRNKGDKEYKDAEGILKTKFGYTDGQIQMLKEENEI